MLRRLVILFAASISFAGCRSSAPVPLPSVFGPTRPVERTITLEEARPFLVSTSGEATRRFEIVAGDDHGRTRIVQVQAHDVQNIRTRVSLDGERHPLSVQSMAVSDTGDLISWRDVNYPHEVFTEFKPPMVIFPRSLDPGGGPVTQSLEFVVHPLANREKVTQRGKAEVAIALVGLETVTAGAREIDAVHVRTTLTVDFGAAKVERTTDEWFCPGVGLVADSFDEKVKVLGVTTEHTAQTAVAEPIPSD